VRDGADRLFEPAGDKVLVFAYEPCRVKVTGKFYVNEHVGIATVKDGKIVRYLEYSDTARMEAGFTE
jgi:ketosteroid isomerase-like protein